MGRKQPVEMTDAGAGADASASQPSAAPQPPAQTASAPAPAVSPVQIVINEKVAREPRQPRQPAPPPIVADEPDDDDDVDFELVDESEQVDEVDPVDEFFNQFGEGYRMDVTRLPDTAEMDGQFRKPCLEIVKCGRLPLRRGSYAEDIKRRLGSGGRVRVQVFDQTSRYQGSITFIVNDPDPPPDMTPAAAPLAADKPAAAPVDPIRRAIERAVTAKIEKLLVDDEPKPEPKAEPTITEEDRLTLKLATDANLLGTVLQRVTTAVATATDKAEPQQRTTAQQALEIFAASPALQARAVNLLDRVTNRFLPPDPAAQQQQLAAHAAQQTAHAGAQQQTETHATMQQQPDLAAVLGAIVTDLNADKEVDVSVDAYLGVIEADPANAQQLDALVSQPPPVVLATLRGYFPAIAPLIDVPHAEEWVSDLQAGIAQRRTAESAAAAIRSALANQQQQTPPGDA